MKIKTSELTRAALDWAVSLITNPDWTDEDRALNTYDYADTGDPDDEPYMPSEDWAQGGPIIEREKISIEPSTTHSGWFAVTYTGCYALPSGRHYADGPTPLVAAMRCYVASKLGDEVEVPDELVPPSHTK